MAKYAKLIVGLVIVAMLYKYVDFFRWFKGDIRLATVAEDGVGLISISPARGVINTANLDKDSMMWMGARHGWYKVDRFNKIINELSGDLEKKMVFWINYGFWPDKVVRVTEIDSWEDWGNFNRAFGILGGVMMRYKISRLFTNDLKIDGMGEEGVTELMSREFADNNIVDQGLQVSVFNNGDVDGLALFASNRLRGMGFNVVEVAPWYGQREDGCMLIKPKQQKRSMDAIVFLERLISYWPNCQIRVDELIDSNTVEIVLDDKWAKMINYDSYVGTF